MDWRLKQWDVFIHWGVDHSMPEALQKRILLSNQISLLLAFLSLGLILLSRLEFQEYPISSPFIIEFIFYLSMPLLNRLGYQRMVLYLLALSMPVYNLGVALMAKYLHPEAVLVVQYFAPRLVILASVVLPLLLLDMRQRLDRWLGLGLPLLCLLSFDGLHWLLGVAPSQVGLRLEGYFIVTAFSVLGYLLFVLSLLALLNVNARYESKVRHLLQELRYSNRELKQSQYQLAEAYEELNASHASISEQKYDLEQRNQQIQRVSQALQRQKETLEEHSQILLLLARSPYVQGGQLAQALAEITRTSAVTMLCTRVSVWEYRNDAQVLEALDCYDTRINQHQSGDLLYLTDYPAFFNIVRQERIVTASDIAQNAHTYEMSEYFAQQQSRALLALSYFMNGLLRGVVIFENAEPRDWDAADVNFLVSIVETITVVYESQERQQALEQIRQQKEEIEAQRDELNRKQEKLLAAQRLIERQNTELIHYNSNLQEMVNTKAAELQAATKDLDTFIYRASHDLKSPLTSLEGLHHLATLELADSPIAREYLERIGQNTQKMHDLLQGLIEVMEIKSMQVERSKVDFKQLVRYQLNLLAQTETLEPLAIDVRACQPLIHTDKELLGAAMYSLIHNAIQYQKPSSPTHHPYLTIRLIDKPKDWLILVRDNGQGIDTAVAPYIFDMFYKATERSKGEGLGLYTAQNAIQKLCGSIHYAKNSLGETAFTIRLPK
ncbi:sensor histidine kinase [Eisenibacter elegans]|uniref:sensor histidine kinase n=1 Tax=Eisenibacter elegans TaxID=997 RepID=UPI000408C0C2|nr:HAMP domain-containing sensor histidine kinase [Eisenibacter elegans]